MEHLGKLDLFDQYYINSQETADVEIVNSRAVDVLGDTVELSVTVINTTGALGQFVFELQGSTDGDTWLRVATIVAQQSGYFSTVETDFAFPFARIQVISSSFRSALFDASLSFNKRYHD